MRRRPVRVLHHTLNYPPDGNSTADLQGELGVELQAMGYEVVALTTTPNANRDLEAEARQPFQRKWRGLLFTSRYHGLKVFHTSIPVKGTRISARFLDYLRFAGLSIATGLFAIREYDVILVPSPPLTIGLSAWVLSRVRRAPFIYVVQEIYPDVAVSFGVLRNSQIIHVMEMLERFVYGRAARIVVISEWFRRRLIEKGVPPEKIRVIHNFVDTEFVQPGERRNSFSAQHGLDDKFVVLYAGNVGLTQSLETLLEAAKLVQNTKDIHFLVVGGGSRFDWLAEQVATGAYQNVTLVPYQPRSLVPLIYSTCDVGLVPLKAGTAQETFPSKVYTIMAAQRPAIAAADRDSEMWWVLGEAACGWPVPPDDARQLASVIEYVFGHPEERQEKGLRGREYVTAHHSRRAAAEQYGAVIREVLAPS